MCQELFISSVSSANLIPSPPNPPHLLPPLGHPVQLFYDSQSLCTHNFFLEHSFHPLALREICMCPEGDVSSTA